MQGKRPPPWLETGFDQTVVHNLGRHSSNRMPHDMFADCDLSPLCSAHSFTVIPLLLSEPTCEIFDSCPKSPLFLWSASRTKKKRPTDFLTCRLIPRVFVPYHGACQLDETSVGKYLIAK